MDHLQDVGDRRRLTYSLFEDLLGAALFEPLAYETLGKRSKRLATDRTRSHDLDEVTKHLSVVSNTRKHAFEKVLVADR